MAITAVAKEIIAANDDYLLHLNNGAQTDPLTRAIDKLKTIVETAQCLT